jgi:hypothetical protein
MDQDRGLRLLAVAFFRHVDAVFRDFHHQVFCAYPCLARQARMRFQAPGFIQQIVFFIARWVQRFKAFPNNDVAGGASAGLIASVVYVDVVIEQHIANGLAAFGLNGGAIWAKFDVGQYDNLWHAVSCSLGQSG